ncbi:MAG: DUF11 domain-containing protein, partial [Chloroflexi bacterium]|nr:DUF11 domain-containing protein [Chloroflexota bacterium]
IGNEPVYIDPDHDNNCATQYTFLDELADLRLTKVSKPDDEVRAGETFTYTILVDNYGPSVARNVVITDTLLNSGLVTIQSCAFSVSQGGGAITQFSCTTGPVVSTQFGSDVGTFATNYLDPRSPSSQGRLRASFRLIANEAIDLNNFATVVAETPDPNMANNEAWDTLSVTAVADLEIGKERIDPPTIEFYTGDPIIYALYVANNGPSTAENVVVKD